VLGAAPGIAAGMSAAVGIPLAKAPALAMAGR
jgi:hypothetical protein